MTVAENLDTYLKGNFDVSLLDFAHSVNAGMLHFPHRMSFVATEINTGAGPPQHGLSSNKMALITSDCGVMCSPSIKWP